MRSAHGLEALLYRRSTRSMSLRTCEDQLSMLSRCCSCTYSRSGCLVRLCMQVEPVSAVCLSCSPAQPIRVHDESCFGQDCCTRRFSSTELCIRASKLSGGTSQLRGPMGTRRRPAELAVRGRIFIALAQDRGLRPSLLDHTIWQVTILRIYFECTARASESIVSLVLLPLQLQP